MSGGAVVGGIVGLIVAWLIAVGKSEAEDLGGGWWRFGGMGCLQNILLYIVLGGIGAAIGAVVAGVLFSP